MQTSTFEKEGTLRKREEREVAIIAVFNDSQKRGLLHYTFSLFTIHSIVSPFLKYGRSYVSCFFGENYMSVMISEPSNILSELNNNDFKKIIHLLDALLRTGYKATASRTTQLLRDLHIQGFTIKK
jgi:hypothetical protein